MKGLVLGIVISASAFTQGAALPSPGVVSVQYSLQRMGGIATNQLAVWIESSTGAYVKTLFATNFMARRKGFSIRPDCCPEWVKASGIASLSQPAIDALSGATQKPGAIALSWDCTDASGKPVASGTYLYKVESNIRWAHRVLWTGKIDVGSAPASSVASAAYLPDEAASKEGKPVSEVSARFTPRPK